ncbi:metallophosphoesterase [Paenibacillus sp. sgz302251]|uniref:metallophosphoesterase n=1 Tax=Paenibacillus sp. sgz302251 TaxID=3414493 RepID=UPI003C7A9B50
MSFLVIVVFIFLIYMFFFLPTMWLKIERVHHPIGLNKRILQISDLHFDMLRISPRKIRQVIIDYKPDYIFLTGDYTYKASFLPRAAQYFKLIAGCGIPVYAVLGNHDYELPRLQRLLDIFKVYHIRVLRNESVQLADFQLVGIDDDCTGHSRIRPAFKYVDEEKPIVVITHDPNVLLRIKRPYHYLMAGHLHGKQLNVPFFFLFKSKGPLSERGIYKGLYTNEYGAFYISKGIGQAGVNARFMVRSELTIHEL